jgi:hypothetical protein
MPMPNLRSIVLAVVAVTTVGAAKQSAPSCVELGTQMRNVSTTRAGASTSVYSCKFDRQAVAQDCSVKTSLATGQTVSQTTHQTWPSIDDLVDQYKVIPPLNYARQLLTGGDGPARVTTYTYDGRKRVAREDVVTAGAKSTLTWSEWDAQGRPTKGKWTGDPAPYFDIDSITYDDGGRKMHREMTGAGATVQDIDFDPQGRAVKVTARSSGGEVVSNLTIQATEKVCK